MRMRIKPWAEPELLDCPFYEVDPKAWRGCWGSRFAARRPLHVEIGCG